MDESVVTLKATVNGLILILREEDTIDAIFEQLEKKLASSGRFFKGASIGVKYRGRKLSDDEAQQISRLMGEKTGAEIKSFEEDQEPPEQGQAANAEPPREKIKIRKLFFKGIEEGATKFYRGTVRSGQLISFDGNIVVIGDVNPGAQVEATGNVIVMGSLRGIVHAGADGNKEAIIAALYLQPTQLRIADIITRPPDEKESRNTPVPEMAFVKEDMVYIERFLPQYK